MPKHSFGLFYFDSAHSLFPSGLEHSEIPTVCFHPDTYSFTDRRIRWSAVFDHAVVFHPGYRERFARAGHPGAFLLPHAVRRAFFEGAERAREFDVGWVGQTAGPLYKTRAEWVPKLAAEFRMNDWTQRFTLEETAAIYQRSHIVVNIGRDDFPQDANLRVFEVLASGALLITSLPSELTQLGFQNGVHFVGYRDHSDLIGIVRRYLADEASRSKIAEAARSLALSEHTYDRRAEQLLEHLAKAGQTRLAPARNWSEPRARLVALDFYASRGLTSCAAAQLRKIAGHGVRETIEGASLLSRSWIKSFIR